MAALTATEAIRRLLTDAIVVNQFPGAVACVGSSAGPSWQEAFGHLGTDPNSAAATIDTWYDLASLTKPLVTAAVIFDLAASGTLAIESPVSAWIPAWNTSERRAITIGDLLEHASGLPPRFDRHLPSTRDGFVDAIASTPLSFVPRTRALYSDLGFILLGLLAERRAGTTLDALFARVLATVVARWPFAREVNFTVPIDPRPPVAPTQPLPEDPRPGPLVGAVHDNYAAALGGVAGHAGVFGSARGVAGVATAILRAVRGESLDRGAFSASWTRRAIEASSVPGSSRGLGWDRMLPTSSCGVRMSPSAFGHVGFTGTSLWIDPERDRFYILLTNRVAGRGTVPEMRYVRRAFHDYAADLEPNVQ